MATSNKIQKEYASTAQVLDVQHEIGRVLERLPKDRANEIIGNKVAFRKVVKAILMNLEISTQTQAVMLQLQGIVDFYKKVCDKDVSEILEYEEVFLQEGFPVLGLTVKSISISDLAEAFKAQKEWGIVFSHQGDLSKIQDHQARPDKELQLFAHKGGTKPDQEVLNASFNEFMKMDKLFASAHEYMVMQGIAKYATGQWLDQKGLTRTSSTWTDGVLLLSEYFDSDHMKIRTSGHRVDNRNPWYGPRQIILL